MNTSINVLCVRNFLPIQVQTCKENGQHYSSRIKTMGCHPRFSHYAPIRWYKFIFLVLKWLFDLSRRCLKMFNWTVMHSYLHMLNTLLSNCKGCMVWLRIMFISSIFKFVYPIYSIRSARTICKFCVAIKRP